MAWTIASRILRGRATGAKMMVLGIFLIFSGGTMDIASRVLTGEGSFASGWLLGVGAFLVGAGAVNYFSEPPAKEEKGAPEPEDGDAETK